MTDVYDTDAWREWVAAVRAAPEDDVPRLACADWLDEQGEADRAEFIRVCVEANASKALCYHDLTQPPDCPTCALHLRAKALSQMWDGDECNWQRWHGLPDIGWACLNLIVQPPVSVEGRQVCGNYLRYRRGFVEELRLPAQIWLAHGEAILAWEPVTKVVLTSWPDVEYMRDGPDDWGEGWSFRDDPQHRLLPLETVRDCLDGIVAGALAARWPVVEFVLPQPEQPTRILRTDVEYRVAAETLNVGDLVAMGPDGLVRAGAGTERAAEAVVLDAAAPADLIRVRIIPF